MYSLRDNVSDVKVVRRAMSLFFRNKSSYSLPQVLIPSPGWRQHQRFIMVDSVTLPCRIMVIDQEKVHLQKSSANASSRPQFESANVCRYNTMLAFRDDPNLFRQHGQLVHHFIQPAKKTTYISDLVGLHIKGGNMETGEDTKGAIVRTPQMLSIHRRRRHRRLSDGHHDACVRHVQSFEAQQKAQNETDGATYEDQPNLPDQCYMQEALRWLTVAPGKSSLQE
ncbi:hypothetical protein CCMA1212_009190 [Trichoderma ghanense]|uniref:Uncharacterized protein n=1 Tax=Trichoderma ghanense TaxID=65468 RepID=A0ABY2GT78_9HYPO